MTNPLLCGLRVLDLTRLLPGPYCTLMLAQLGAEVVKIEEPQGGDYARVLWPELFALVNRGKRSVTLDLRQATDVEHFKHLVADADVVVESFRPGVMDRLGCGYETLNAIRPSLVYASLTGYGQTGPWKDRAGHDLNYSAYAGTLDQSGDAGQAPAMSNLQIADLAGGALHAAVGILAAVHGARSSGIGSHVDIAMLDGLLALQCVATATLRTLGHAQPRGQDMLSGALPNYSVYACAGGGYLAVGALEPKFWQAFCAAVQRPDLAARMPAPGPAGAAVRQALTELIATRTRDEWESLLQTHDACAGGVYALDEALASAHCQARSLVESIAGKPAVGCPLMFDGQRPPPAEPAPALGADTPTLLTPDR